MNLTIKPGFEQWWRENHVPSNKVPFRDGEQVIRCPRKILFVVDPRKPIEDSIACQYSRRPASAALVPARFLKE